MSGAGGYAIVVPTLGRPSLRRLLDTLARQRPAPDELVIVDDRPGIEVPALDALSGGSPLRPLVLRGYGRGPAAARNTGWHATSASWVVFLDDDVELPDTWAPALKADLDAAADDLGGSQGRLRVPLPTHRRPTDWERGTAGLERAAWATADMAYRRAALVQVGGFDERFPRAYREDADLALRVRRAGWRLARGERVSVHPVRPVDDHVSVRQQRGNADDVLMRRLHGRRWRREAQAPRGRFALHAVTTAAAGIALGCGLLGRRTPAVAAALTWAGLTADFAVRRLVPGPRPGEPYWWDETRRMLLTSVAIPPAAVAHRLAAAWHWRAGAPPWPLPLRAVLFDRDGTLVHDVPHNGDPARVRPVDGARQALELVRRAGLATGVVSNQSGIGRGLLRAEDVVAVNAEIERRLGPFATWQVCPHRPEAGCTCRKPAPGLVLSAAAALGIRPEQCAVVGDIGSDVRAAVAAGARAVLVPTPVTRLEEVAEAPLVAATLTDAVELLLDAGQNPGVAS